MGVSPRVGGHLQGGGSAPGGGVHHNMSAQRCSQVSLAGGRTMLQDSVAEFQGGG